MIAVALAVSTGLLVGCEDEPAPEERLAETREALAEVRREVATLESKVERKREAVRRAEDALAQARQELEQAENDLARVRGRLDQRATRVALFRAVQKALLESESLEDYAIRVEVADGRVTLRGEVDREAQRERALALARKVIGADESGLETMDVTSEIRVRQGAGEGAASSSRAAASGDGGADSRRAGGESKSGETGARGGSEGGGDGSKSGGDGAESTRAASS
jgi:outer membrane murein-binding lipoprotein Lpp